MHPARAAAGQHQSQLWAGRLAAHSCLGAWPLPQGCCSMQHGCCLTGPIPQCERSGGVTAVAVALSPARQGCRGHSPCNLGADWWQRCAESGGLREHPAGADEGAGQRLDGHDQQVRRGLGGACHALAALGLPHRQRRWPGGAHAARPPAPPQHSALLNSGLQTAGCATHGVMCACTCP